MVALMEEMEEALRLKRRAAREEGGCWMGRPRVGEVLPEDKRRAWEAGVGRWETPSHMVSLGDTNSQSNLEGESNNHAPTARHLGSRTD